MNDVPNDVPLDKAMLVWGRSEGQDGPPVQVVGGPVVDERRYGYSVGACDSAYNTANNSEKLNLLLLEGVNLTVRHGISPQDFHEAMLVIPEYREAMEKSDAIRPDHS